MSRRLQVKLYFSDFLITFQYSNLFSEITMLKSSAGHCYLAPKLDEVEVFRIGGSQMINLHVGTWHQGPFFEPPEMDFYNLELSNTGVSHVVFVLHSFGINVNCFLF